MKVALGAVGGGAGSRVAILVRAKLMEKSISPALKVLIVGSSGGGAAGFTSQFLTELWSFVIEGKPVTVEAIKGSGARTISYTFVGLFSGGLTAKVDVSKMASFGLARKQVEKGYAAIPLGGIKGYMNKLSISGAAGITGSGLLGNYFAEFAMDLFNIE